MNERMREKKRVKQNYGAAGGLEGYDVGGCPDVPSVRLILIGKNLHYIHKDHLEVVEEE